MGGYKAANDDQSLDTAEIIGILNNLSERMGSVEDAVGRLDETIRGNGKQGLVTQVALLQQIVTEIEKKSASGDKRFISWAWLVEKVFMPIAMTLITAVIMAKLLGA